MVPDGPTWLETGAPAVGRTLVVGVDDIFDSSVAGVIQELVQTEQPKHAPSLTAALELAERAVALVHGTGGAGAPWADTSKVADLLVDVATGFKALGQPDAARERLERAAHALVQAFDGAGMPGDEVLSRFSNIFFVLSIDDVSGTPARLRALERTFLEKYVAALEHSSRRVTTTRSARDASAPATPSSRPSPARRASSRPGSGSSR